MTIERASTIAVFLVGLERGGQEGVGATDQMPEPSQHRRQQRAEGQPGRRGTDAERVADAPHYRDEVLHVLIPTLCGALISGLLIGCVLADDRFRRLRSPWPA